MYDEQLVPETTYQAGTILRADVGGGEVLSVHRTVCDRAIPGQAILYGGVDAHLARLYLHQTFACDIVQNGRRVPLPPRHSMETSFRFVEAECAWPITHAIDIVSFELPRSAVRRWADEADYRNFSELKIDSGMAAHDETIKTIGMALLGNLTSAESGSRLFIDSLFEELCRHLVARYGGRAYQKVGGGLSLWQQRRAMDIIDAHLDGDIPLRWLAGQCGLSVAHFTRAFRQSVGQSPHRWMLQRRIRRAVNLLSFEHLSLSEVALCCGFSDQSHFTHVFTRWVGVSPGTYRRRRETGLGRLN